ncbi:DUF4124 domain-containing protein [Thiorhodococcus mannitoliphagus]|uniref:DUF4124 domain-containing protein n=1 Tax=Thiorhodococcus mannitoliphagus TaxID=329406 RepID=A0A6P1DQ89_9GAMM|nr:DUF4124 domain-containing protein [Thiorhodococcus mannitoliphagus]NEX18826.1 DUF4124 domain-containing protein [Thiorhodococcus mannitoliphagus]
MPSIPHHQSRRIPFAQAAVAALAVTIALGHAQAQQLYRWVDDNGEVQYTDKIPPSQADKARARISEEGVQVEEVPPAPTEEEIQKAAEQERQKAEEAKRLAAQKAADERLLRTHKTIDDLELARNGKIAAVEAVIQMKRDGVRAETSRLLKLNDKIAQLKKDGKPVSDALQKEVDEAVVSIRNGYAEVVENEYRKQAIRNEFREIVARYRKLKRLPEPDESNEPVTSELRLSILVACKNAAQCNKYWERANDYVRSHSNVKTEVAGPGLLIGFAQDEREDRSLTLSWTQTAPNKPVHLYLDVQCKNRLTASLYCMNPTIPEIRDGFHSSLVRADDPQMRP